MSVTSAGSQRIPRFLMFHDRGEEVEYIEPRDYAHITELVRKRDPAKIAVGRHNDDEMMRALGEAYAARTVDSWTLGVRWLECLSGGKRRAALREIVEREETSAWVGPSK